MEIKVVEEIVRTKKVNKYVAFDGTEFKDKWDCEEYEYRAYRKMLEERNDIVYSENLDGYVPLDCEYSYDDEDSYCWYKPLTKEAVDFINKMHDTDTVNGVSYSGIGEWVCFEKNSDGEFYPYYFEDSVRAAIDLFKALGYNMFLEKIEEEK